MAILNTITELQLRHAAVTGVVWAPPPADYPESLKGAQLPCALTWPEEGSWAQHSWNALRQQQRRYRVQVFVRPVAQGRGVGAAIVDLATLAQRLGEAYLAVGTFNLADPPPTQMTILTDDRRLRDAGGVVLTYAGVDYHGLEFTVEVLEVQ